MLYTQYETIKFAMQPFSYLLSSSLAMMDSWNQNYPQFSSINNYRQARYALTNNLIKNYPKMPWNLHSIVDENGISHEVVEKLIIDKSFCDFKLFCLEGLENRPVLLMAAPLSGHYATLLRDTLQTFLKDYDVYITDWKNCRDIPVSQGSFNLQNYVEYIIEFSKYVKDKHGVTNILAVCQPTVPVAVAASYFAKNEPQYTFDNVVLMGGPLDTRMSPTKVNQYALKHPIDWFKSNVIKTVPIYFSGRGRKVYPGFLQHMGFLSMNMKRHTKAHIDFFNDLIVGANLDAQKHQEFYNEYNAVMDLPAEYYIDTLNHVFLDQSLAKDKMEIFGQKISMSDITTGRYLLLEGELDDISGSGQTYAAYNMLVNLPVDNKKKYMAENVGHYGIFSGKGFRRNIYPAIKAFINNAMLNDMEKSNVNQNGDILHIQKNKDPVPEVKFATFAPVIPIESVSFETVVNKVSDIDIDFVSIEKNNGKNTQDFIPEVAKEVTFSLPVELTVNNPANYSVSPQVQNEVKKEVNELKETVKPLKKTAKNLDRKQYGKKEKKVPFSDFSNNDLLVDADKKSQQVYKVLDSSQSLKPFIENKESLNLETAPITKVDKIVKNGLVKLENEKSNSDKVK